MGEHEPFAAARDIDYAGGGPALLFGADDARRGEMAALLADAGVRLAAAVPLERAAERLDEQVSLALAWAEVGPDDQLGDALLDRLEQEAARGTAVVVSVPSSQIDAAVAALTHPPSRSWSTRTRLSGPARWR